MRGVLGNGNLFGPTDVGLVRNIYSFIYWSESSYPITPDSAIIFMFNNGLQDSMWKGSERYAWAVRDGDVISSVPEPGSIALIGLALAGGAQFRRKQVATN